MECLILTFLLISPEIQTIQGSQVCDTCREVPDTNLRTLCQLCAWGLDTLCVCVCVRACMCVCGGGGVSGNGRVELIHLMCFEGESTCDMMYDCDPSLCHD